MLLKDTNTCFACGKLNEQGLKLDIRKTANGVETEFAFPERFQGWQGVVHGGLVATVLDELVAWASKMAGHNAVTAELVVRFRRPLKTNQPFRGQGWITAEHGRLLLAQSRLWDTNSELIAEASAKLMKV